MTYAIVPAREKQATLRDLLAKARESFAAVLPRHLTVERLFKVALAATARTPKLLECTPASLVGALMQSAQLGLEPNTPMQLAFLVPFGKQVTLMLGFRGLIDLARRSGRISTIEAHVVHEADSFEYELGLTPTLRHRPDLCEPGQTIAAYAIATMVDGQRQVEVMTVPQIEHVRGKSRAAKDGPWVTDWDEMAKKTVCKRLCKYLPVSVEMATAIAVDDHAETGEGDLGEFVDVEEEDKGIRAKVAERVAREEEGK